MLSDPMKKTAIGLTAVGMCNYLAHGYARAPDVICPTEVVASSLRR